jgi:23S rRNA (adenine2503-C2)-methyltransferase
MAGQGEPAFRARQVYRHLYHGLADDLAQMTDLPVGLRERLGQAVLLTPLRPLETLISPDGHTRKALFALPDGESIESVLMETSGGEGQERVRRTVCVSTQAGCAMGCVFCATGQGGLRRNLTSGEIVSQVLHFARELRRTGAEKTVTHVIVAGMGEPLVNYDATLQALYRLNDPDGFGLGSRHITISTAGWVPGIQRLAAEKLQVNLAVSLHAPTEALRSKLMPVNRKGGLAALLPACQAYAKATGRRVTYEYILIEGVNASLAHARQLADLLRGSLSHVNLIPVNPVEGLAWRPPSPAAVRSFAAALERAGVPVSLRVERGGEISAACGQLRAHSGESKATCGQLRAHSGESKATCGQLRAHSGESKATCGQLRARSGESKATCGQLRARRQDAGLP